LKKKRPIGKAYRSKKGHKGGTGGAREGKLPLGMSASGLCGPRGKLLRTFFPVISVFKVFFGGTGNTLRLVVGGWS